VPEPLIPIQVDPLTFATASPVAPVIPPFRVWPSVVYIGMPKLTSLASARTVSVPITLNESELPKEEEPMNVEPSREYA
jgi:hypothetical protein